MSDQNPQAQSNPAGPPAPLSPELIKKVADKVYAMLLADLRLEAERQRRSPTHAKGGR